MQERYPPGQTPSHPPTIVNNLTANHTIVIRQGGGWGFFGCLWLLTKWFTVLTGVLFGVLVIYLMGVMIFAFVGKMIGS